MYKKTIFIMGLLIAGVAVQPCIAGRRKNTAKKKGGKQVPRPGTKKFLRYIKALEEEKQKKSQEKLWKKAMAMANSVSVGNQQVRKSNKMDKKKASQVEVRSWS